MLKWLRGGCLVFVFQTGFAPSDPPPPPPPPLTPPPLSLPTSILVFLCVSVCMCFKCTVCQCTYTARLLYVIASHLVSLCHSCFCVDCESSVSVLQSCRRFSGIGLKGKKRRAARTEYAFKILLSLAFYRLLADDLSQ